MKNDLSRDMKEHRLQRLADAAPELERILMSGGSSPAVFLASEISRDTVWVTMRDGVRLATDLYLPPRRPAPAIAMRTPYDRAQHAEAFVGLAQRGYVVISQDCRGTGDSEPDSWDFYIYEREDSLDFVDWVTRQEWFDGFLGSCGGSYNAQTQWCMAMHPRMSAIAPEVGGLGIAFYTVHFYMFLNAYSRSVGKGADKVPVSYEVLERQMLDETLAGGYFNEPLHKPFSDALLERYPYLRSLPPGKGKRWLWENYCALGPEQRAEMIKLALGKKNITFDDVESMSAVFGHQTCVDGHMFLRTRDTQLLQSLKAPGLLITGWYDWFLDDVFATWDLLMREAPECVSSRSRLLITPSAHNMPGYREGREDHPELEQPYRLPDTSELLLRWYAAVRQNAISSWPMVTYYLMGANEWYASSSWPPPEAKPLALYLGPSGALIPHAPQNSAPDTYTYNPEDPTPTVGGSIVSYVYTPGSVDVSKVHQRPDVLSYTTGELPSSLDVVGPLRLILYASSSAVDTDFSARLSDVFPDGRAIQLQNRMLRARYRDLNGDPELLEPGRIYRFEIDMCATANRFKVGHRLRLDISSADFPKFDRNTNRGGEPGPPIPALQTIYHDPEHPSNLLVSVMGNHSTPE
jgi:predicted acyl esterase